MEEGGVTTTQAEEPAGKRPQLWDVPPGAPIQQCRACSARIQFTPGKSQTSRIPASIDSPFAVWAPDGSRCLRAPSHFTDCTDPGRFSRRRG
jgi:hypothetical protein